MKEKLTSLEKLEDFIDPRAKDLLSKYDLSILELPDLKSRLHKRGKFRVSPLTSEKLSIINEMIANAILCFELANRKEFLIPYNETSLAAPIDREKMYRNFFHYKRERSIESYERIGRELLKYATKLDRCGLNYYFRPFLDRLPKPPYELIHSIVRFCNRTLKNKT